jgi:hypothetical protein
VISDGVVSTSLDENKTQDEPGTFFMWIEEIYESVIRLLEVVFGDG